MVTVYLKGVGDTVSEETFTVQVGAEEEEAVKEGSTGEGVAEGELQYVGVGEGGEERENWGVVVELPGVGVEEEDGVLGLGVRLGRGVLETEDERVGKVEKEAWEEEVTETL